VTRPLESEFKVRIISMDMNHRKMQFDKKFCNIKKVIFPRNFCGIFISAKPVSLALQMAKEKSVQVSRAKEKLQNKTFFLFLREPLKQTLLA
jgi:hypothetical protein